MKRLFNEISGKLVNYHSFGPHGECSAIRLNSSNCQGRAGSTRLNGLQVQISITLLAKWDLSNIHQLRFLPLCSLWATAWQKLCSQENILGVWTALGWLGASVATVSAHLCSWWNALKGMWEYWFQMNTGLKTTYWAMELFFQAPAGKGWSCLPPWSSPWVIYAQHRWWDSVKRVSW